TCPQFHLEVYLAAASLPKKKIIGTDDPTLGNSIRYTFRWHYSMQYHRSRVGSLATLYIASLAVFPRLSFGATFLNVSLKTYRRLHVSIYLNGRGLAVVDKENLEGAEENNTDGNASRITVLAKVKLGFTRRLATYLYNSLRILLDGPYSKPKDTVHYNNFVFIATSIRILV
ncbi:hypothetical protein F1880_007451, partial [Penicillium rolfsii]